MRCSFAVARSGRWVGRCKIHGNVSSFRSSAELAAVADQGADQALNGPSERPSPTACRTAARRPSTGAGPPGRQASARENASTSADDARRKNWMCRQRGLRHVEAHVAAFPPVLGNDPPDEGVLLVPDHQLGPEPLVIRAPQQLLRPPPCPRPPEYSPDEQVHGQIQPDDGLQSRPEDALREAHACEPATTHPSPAVASPMRLSNASSGSVSFRPTQPGRQLIASSSTTWSRRSRCLPQNALAGPAVANHVDPPPDRDRVRLVPSSGRSSMALAVEQR